MTAKGVAQQLVERSIYIPHRYWLFGASTILGGAVATALYPILLVLAAECLGWAFRFPSILFLPVLILAILLSYLVLSTLNSLLIRMGGALTLDEIARREAGNILRALAECRRPQLAIHDLLIYEACRPLLAFLERHR